MIEVNGVKVNVNLDNTYTEKEINYLKRAYLELEDKNFTTANQVAEACLEINVENAEAWLVKFLVDFNYTSLNHLSRISSQTTFNKLIENTNFQKVIRFSGPNLEKTIHDTLQLIKDAIKIKADVANQNEISYLNYLKEELAKMGIGERILALKNKRSTTSTNLGKLIYPLIVIICLICSVIYGAEFLIRYSKETLIEGSIDSLLLFYGLFGGIVSLSIIIASKIISSLLGSLINKNLYSKKITLGLLTKAQYIKGDRIARYSNLEDLEKVRSFIYSNNYKKELLYINHKK